MIPKRGQAAAGAAVLLAVIAGILIFFVILLPPQERADLLDVEGANGTSVKKLADENVTLLTESPGRIDYLAQKELEHRLPVVSIYTRKESTIIAEKGFVSSKKAVFTEKNGEFVFSLDDLENTDNVLLSFTVKDVEGDVIISLNGEGVYNGAIESNKPINLPKNFLQKQNVIEFSSESIGVAFWATNNFAATNLKVVADVTNTDAQTSKNVFLVSETEKNNLEKVELRFQPDCIFSQVGKLSVTVNNLEVYNAVPDCGLKMIPIEFSPSVIQEGENAVIFHTEKGTYQLSHAVVKSKLKEVDFPTYYFELSNEEFKEIQDEDKRLRLELNFVDISNDKEGDIIFNGHMKSFDTKEVEYVIDISDDAVKGNNAVKIRPRKTLEIREINIELVDK